MKIPDFHLIVVAFSVFLIGFTFSFRKATGVLILEINQKPIRLDLKPIARVHRASYLRKYMELKDIVLALKLALELAAGLDVAVVVVVAAGLAAAAVVVRLACIRQNSFLPRRLEEEEMRAHSVQTARGPATDSLGALLEGKAFDFDEAKLEPKDYSGVAELVVGK